MGPVDLLNMHTSFSSSFDLLNKCMLILYQYTICNTNIKVPVLWTQSVMKVLYILCYSVNSGTDSHFGPIVLERNKTEVL